MCEEPGPPFFSRAHRVTLCCYFHELRSPARERLTASSSAKYGLLLSRFSHAHDSGFDDYDVFFAFRFFGVTVQLPRCTKCVV